VKYALVVAMNGRAALALVAMVLVGAGCGGSTYGHAPRYVPSGDEEQAVAGAAPYDAAAAGKRGDAEPRAGAARAVTLFGVVESRAAGPGGQALLKMTVRSLEPKNDCARAGDDDSCRVTVSDKDFGVVWALVELRADDDVGPRAVGQRSLLRLVGSVGQDVSPADGTPIVHARWYRHWPAQEYLSR
jgi:hypothetical protein